MPRGGGAAGSLPLPFTRHGGEVEAAASQVQRVFRNRRQDSRRRAALAIERIYLRSRRRGHGGQPPPPPTPTQQHAPHPPHPPHLPHRRKRPALARATVMAPSCWRARRRRAWARAARRPAHPHSPPRFEALRAVPGAGSGSPMLLATGGIAPPHLQPLPESAELVAEPPDGVDGVGVGGMDMDGALGAGAMGVGMAAADGVIRQAQTAFRTRRLRQKAVRVIESAWSEYQYHSEQAVLAAADAERAPSHAYHARRRERAARVIQGYLQRQQQASSVAGGAGGAGGEAMMVVGGDGRSMAVVAGGGPVVYSAAELDLLQKVQRNFRALMRRQAEEAEEALHATRTASQRAGGEALDDGGYHRLCDILKKAAAQPQPGTGAASGLSDDDRNHLAKLQLAWREHLERKRPQAPAQPWGDADAVSPPGAVAPDAAAVSSWMR